MAQAGKRAFDSFLFYIPAGKTKKKKTKTAMGSYDAKGEQSQSGGEVLLYLHEKPGCSTPQPGSSGVDSEGP